MPDKIDYDPVWDNDTEPVYFHILYSVDPGRQDYNAVSNYNNVNGKIRLFVPSEGRWRNATDVEQVVYSLWGQQAIQAFKTPYKDLEIHGFYISGPTKAFRLQVKFMEKHPKKKSAKKKKKDLRTVNRGRRCESYNVLTLIQILDFLDVSVPEIIDTEFIDSMTKAQLVSNIISTLEFRSFNTEKVPIKTLKYYLGWIQYRPEGKKKDGLCSIIEQKLIDIKLIYQTY